MTAGSAYGWLERRLFEVLGGWVPSTPEPEVKLLLRRHSFQHAWHAELWEELWEDVPGPAAPTPSLERLVEVIAAPEATPARLVGVYGVLLPGLVASYRGWAETAAGPVARVLRLVLADEAAAVAEARGALERYEDVADAHRSAAAAQLANTPFGQHAVRPTHRAVRRDETC